MSFNVGDSVRFRTQRMPEGGFTRWSAIVVGAVVATGGMQLVVVEVCYDDTVYFAVVEPRELAPVIRREDAPDPLGR